MRTIRRLFWCLSFGLIILGGGCGESLHVQYNYDNNEMVETALIMKGESLVAIGKRVAIRWVPGPEGALPGAEVEVEETHFTPGTQNVVYKGRLVFRCRFNEDWCERIADTGVSGSRPRDVLRRWPYSTFR
ncbi:MAG: hypothetical protein ACREBG_21900 [Pyrinomonadaceae bacterium]